MTVALSFVGTGNYQSTVYQWKGQRCQTNLFPVAVQQFFQPQHLVLCITEGAQQKYRHRLEQALTGKAQLHWIMIPDGKSEEELWEIFRRLVEKLGAIVDASKQAPQRLVLDITHGFRMLPVIALGTVTYFQELLRQKGVSETLGDVQIVYGAFDASVDGNTPVIDVSSFWYMLEWTAALQKVRDTYRFDLLVQTLQYIARRSQGLRQKGKGKIRQQLETFGRKAQELGLAFQFAQPLLVMEKAEDLWQTGTEVQQILGQHSQLLPLMLVFDELQRDFDQLRYANAGQRERRNEALQNTLVQQLYFLHLLRQAQLYPQLALAVREFLITGIALQLGVADIWNRKERKAVAAQLNKAVRQHQRQVLENKLLSSEWITLWSKVPNLRNEIAHIGMGKRDPYPRRLWRWQRLLDEVLEELQPLIKQLQEHQSGGDNE